MANRHHGQRNILFQAWRIHRRGHLADHLAVYLNGPELRVGARERLTVKLEANLLAGNPLLLRLFKCGFPNEVCGHLKIYQPVQTELKGVGVGIHVRVVGEHAALNASNR